MSQLMGRRVDIRGEVYAATAAVLFGTAYVATAVALRDFTPAATGAWRGILATSMLASAIVSQRFISLSMSSVQPGGWPRLAVIAILGGPAFLAWLLLSEPLPPTKLLEWVLVFAGMATAAGSRSPSIEKVGTTP